MPELRIGIQLASLRQPLKRAIQTASQLGATAVEIDVRNQLKPGELSQTGLRQFRKNLEDLNLSVCAVTFRTRRGYNVIDDLQRRVEATKRAMDFAYSLGCNTVVNQVGRVPDQPEGTDWDVMIEALDEIGRHGQHCGAMLAAKTGTEAGSTLAALIEAIPSGGIFADFDPGNLIVNGFSADESLDALSNHVVHVHAKDGVRDLAQGRGVEVPLGRGTVDFPTLLGKLEERSYRGYFTIEREHSDNPIADVANAVKYLQNL